MKRFYAYIYLSVFWSLRYIFPLIALLMIIILIVLSQWRFIVFIIMFIFADFLILHFFKQPKKIISKSVGVPYIKKKYSDFLLIVSLKGITESSKNKNFELQDWSNAWINTLMQEAGAFSVIDIEEANKKQILSRRVIILSKSATKCIDQRILGTLEIFVEKGGVLLLDLDK